MKREREFSGCVLVHTRSGLTYLLDGPKDLTDLMDGDLFDDACMETGRKTLPTEPGVYMATVEYWFQMGYFEGYPAPGESDYDFRLSNLQRTALTTPATVPSEPGIPEDLMQYLLDVKVFLSFLGRDFKSDRIDKLMAPPVPVYVQLEKMLEQYVYRTDWYNDKVFGPAKEPV